MYVSLNERVDSVIQHKQLMQQHQRHLLDNDRFTEHEIFDKCHCTDFRFIGAKFTITLFNILD